MSNPCRVCSHPACSEIEYKVRQGIALVTVAASYSLSKTSLSRHMNTHALGEPGVCSEKPRQILDTVIPIEEKPAGRLDAYESIQRLRQVTDQVLERAINDGDDRMTLYAMSEARKNIETMVKVYETQERLLAQLAGREDFSASAVYQFLKHYHPEVLAELVGSIRASRGLVSSIR